MELSQFVGGSVYAFILVFVRIGAAFMTMPAIGEQFVSVRVRLLFALMVALVVTPAVRPLLPPQPDNPADLGALVMAEVLVGVFIGGIARMMLSALDFAGQLIANQLGLAAAQAFNPALAAPGNPVGAILSLLGIMLIFATDLHHMLILAVVDSYTLFGPGTWLPLGDVAQHMARVMARSFVIGMQMSAPFLVLGLLFYLGLGLISRLVPQVQVFFVGIPLQIVFGLLLFGISLSALMLFWLAAFEDQLITILAL